MDINTRQQTLLSYFILIFFIFLIFPPFLYQQPVGGLDPSWNIAIHLAYKYHLTFGKDFIFTYGPLGILHTRLPISINMYVYILFDLYFLVTIFLILREILLAHFNKWVVVFIFLCITLAMYDSWEQWYFMFFLYYLFRLIKNPEKKAVAMFQVCLLSLISFYFKVSLGITAINILLIVMVYLVIRKRIKLTAFISILVLYFGVLYTSARLLNVELGSYIKTSLSFINDYNDAMFRQLGDAYLSFVYAAVFILAAFVACITYRLIVAFKTNEFIKRIDELCIASIVGLAVFVLFKSGFVRGDSHVHLFFKGISIVMGLLYLFSSRLSDKKMAAVLCWATVIISIWAVNFIPGSYQPSMRIINLSILPIKAREIGHYIRDIGNYSAAVAASDKLESAPNELRDLIGDHTIDVLPADISKVYFNGLRYNPRPVIQSYAAYNAYFDSLNYKKYTSPDAPDYVLFTSNSIDNRFPFFDESKTKQALLTHYVIAAHLNHDLLLKKRANPESLRQTASEKITNGKFGEDIYISSHTGLQYAQITVDYNLWGKLTRLFYKPPVLKIIFTFENDEKEEYRVIKPILSGGVLVNKYIDNEEDFQILMQSAGRLNTNVKSIRFISEPANSGYVSNIRISSSYYEFPLKTETEHSADSIALADLYMRQNISRPILLDISSVIPDTCKTGLEFVKAQSNQIKVNGWAFREHADNKNLIPRAALVTGTRVYELPSESRDRPDVGSYFKRGDLANAGFYSETSKKHLMPGDYKLGVIIIDTVTKKRWLSYPEHAAIRIIPSDTISAVVR